MLRSHVAYTLQRYRSYRGRRLRAISREAFFRVARRFTPELVSELDGMRFSVPTYDRAVALQAFANGPPERQMMGRAITALEALTQWRGSDAAGFLEIGANLGTATVLALRDFDFARAVCFEPLPANYRLLVENIRANGLSERARTTNAALSDKVGTAQLEVPADNSGDARIRADEPSGGELDAFGESARSSVTIEVTTVDSLCEKGEIDLGSTSLAWIDAQGHEGHILSGAQQLLGSSVPVVVEFWPYGLNRAGGARMFVEAVQGNYDRFVDLGLANGSPFVTMEADSVEGLLRKYQEGSFLDPAGATSSTDLLLFKD